MSLKMKTSSAGEYEVPPAGNQAAVCVGIVELGRQHDVFQGQDNGWKTKVLLVFELDEKKSDGAPFVIGRDYNASLNKKANLRAVVERWRGKPLADDEEFDLTKLVGKGCLLSILQKQSASGSDYAKIESIGALPKGMTAPKPVNKAIIWEIGPNNPAPDEDWLPRVYGKTIAEVVAQSQERGGGNGNGSSSPNNGNGGQTSRDSQADGEEWI